MVTYPGFNQLLNQTMQLKDHLKQKHKLIIVNSERLSTGFGIKGHKIWLDNGQIAAVKSNLSQRSPNLLIEAQMLESLKEAGWPVPDVWAVDDHCLVMQWLKNDNSQLSQSAEFKTGQNLAKLHQKTAPKFGFANTTPIGPISQPNQETSSWLEFFKQKRLMHMAVTAYEKEVLPAHIFERLQAFCENLENYLEEPEKPSLIHGDIWGGNVMVHQGQLTGFIDPAIYYADKEIELAFTQMFSTFGHDFFKGYQAITPLEPAFFKERIDIYNLYPTLVHVHLFGNSYVPPIDLTLNKFGY